MSNQDIILTALDEIEHLIQEHREAMGVAGVVDKDSLYNTYQRLRPCLEVILPVIDKTSLRLSSILRLLMQIADSTGATQAGRAIR